MNINTRIREILEASPFLTYPQVGGGDPNRGGVTGRLYATEGAVKDALADYLYSIPQAAIEELRPVMKTKSLQKRFRDINSVLKRHGFTADFMGSRPANVVNDYYETFFG